MPEDVPDTARPTPDIRHSARRVQCQATTDGVAIRVVTDHLLTLLRSQQRAAIVDERDPLEVIPGRVSHHRMWSVELILSRPYAPDRRLPVGRFAKEWALTVEPSETDPYVVRVTASTATMRKAFEIPWGDAGIVRVQDKDGSVGYTTRHPIAVPPALRPEVMWVNGPQPLEAEFAGRAGWPLGQLTHRVRTPDLPGHVLAAVSRMVRDAGGKLQPAHDAQVGLPGGTYIVDGGSASPELTGFLDVEITPRRSLAGPRKTIYSSVVSFRPKNAPTADGMKSAARHLRSIDRQLSVLRATPMGLNG